jgi:glycosyltransferase involved in cell wall biosynthesis
LFEEVEIGVLLDRFVHASSLRSRLRHGLTWAKHRRYVAHLLGSFRACTVASDNEKQLLAQIAPTYQAVHVLPNCVRVADYARSPVVQPNRLIFTGSFRYWPNYEAMQWFVQQVYPRIQAEVPNVTLAITGDHANLPLPADDSVTLTGFVDDVQRQIAQSWVSVAPIHNGGGTRLKVLEAMASGTPVVTTSKGAEGLDVQHERHLFIADTPELFAGAVIRLLREPQLRQRLAANAYAKVCEAYDWDATMPRFLQIVEQVAAQ